MLVDNSLFDRSIDLFDCSGKVLAIFLKCNSSIVPYLAWFVKEKN